MNSTPTSATKAATAATDANSSNNKGPPSAVEFEPPLACVRRILKNSLPASTNVGKDASAAFARASGIFIIYLTACANDFARENRRQTITANDVLAAIKELEFDEFAPQLEKFLEEYRESEKNKKVAKAKAAAAAAEEEEKEESTPTSQKSSNMKDAEMATEDEVDDTNHGDEEEGDDLEEMEE